MNLFVSSPDWIVWLLVAFLAAATIQDAVQLKISNYICAAVLVLAVVAMALSGFRVSLWQNVVIFTAILTIGAFLFERGVLGGGDVKLFAAVGFWANLQAALWLVVSVAIAGGLLALAMIFLRTFVPKGLARRVKTLQPKAGIAYGIAITAGTLMMLVPGPREKSVPYVPISAPAKAPAQSG